MNILKIYNLIKQGMTIPLLGIETNFNLFLSKKSLFNRFPCPTKNGAIAFNSLLFTYIFYLLITSVYDGNLGVNIPFIATVAVATLLSNGIIGTVYFLKIRTREWEGKINAISLLQGVYSAIEESDAEMIGLINGKTGAFGSDISDAADIICRYVIKRQKIDPADFALIVLALAFQHSRANGVATNVSHGVPSELVMIDYLLKRARSGKDTEDLLEARKAIESRYQNQILQINAAKKASVVNLSSTHKKLAEMPSVGTADSVVMTAEPIKPTIIAMEDIKRPVSTGIDTTATIQHDESSAIVGKEDAVDAESSVSQSVAVPSDKINQPPGSLGNVLIAGETEPEQEDVAIGYSDSSDEYDEIENEFFNSQDDNGQPLDDGEAEDNGEDKDEDVAGDNPGIFIDLEIDGDLTSQSHISDEDELVEVDEMISFAVSQGSEDSDFPIEKSSRDIDFDCENELQKLLHDLK